ncbi:MAG TPA: hypothetical protein VJA21_27810 [Verrucomicrobiae bacterium]
MSEFKFACPFCGQHISAASNSSGTSITCPTCFQQIVVPQAPAGADSKFILAATQANRPRPTTVVGDLGPVRRSGSRASLIASILLVLILGVGAAVIYVSRAKIWQALRLGGRHPEPVQTNEPPAAVPNPARWTLNPAEAMLPDHPASGQLHGTNFVCEHAIFASGVLSVRQGPGWPPDLGVDILLTAQTAQQLVGKTIVIAPGAKSVVSKVILRWKDDQRQPRQEEITTGYALTLVFGHIAGGRLSGKLHVSLPDADRSFVAGTFDAEIIKPQPSGK